MNQYDSPLDVYSDDTLEEMKEERLVMQNPDLAERINKVHKPFSAIYYMYIADFNDKYLHTFVGLPLLLHMAAN